MKRQPSRTYSDATRGAMIWLAIKDVIQAYKRNCTPVQPTYPVIWWDADGQHEITKDKTHTFKTWGELDQS